MKRSYSCQLESQSSLTPIAENGMKCIQISVARSPKPISPSIVVISRDKTSFKACAITPSGPQWCMEIRTRLTCETPHRMSKCWRSRDTESASLTQHGEARSSLWKSCFPISLSQSTSSCSVTSTRRSTRNATASCSSIPARGTNRSWFQRRQLSSQWTAKNLTSR